MGSSSDLIIINQKKKISELLSFKGFLQAAIDLLNARDDLFNLDEDHYQTDLFAKGMGELQSSEDDLRTDDFFTCHSIGFTALRMSEKE